MKFLEGLSDDIRLNLLDQLRVLWTHTSTAIEGNTLTLGETAFVLREGLTINGKPLKDHRDVQGHARAVDLIFGLVEKETIISDDLFDLHRLVINEQIFDVYKPIGNWKNENNSTSLVIENVSKIVEFSDFWNVPGLMDRWLDLLNSEIENLKAIEEVPKVYAKLHISFVAIHPFWDGNGRIARLVANLPCLKAGYPPIIIEKERRYDYIMALARYTLAHGVPEAGSELYVEGDALKEFTSFCSKSWGNVLSLVDEAHALQKKRDRRHSEASKPEER